MQLTKPRFWLLVLLLSVYLLGVLFLSAIALHEPKNRSIYSSKITDHTISSSNHLRSSGSSLQLQQHNRAGFIRRNRIQWCGDLRFIQPPQEPVALASFPGSGNTWLRYLLQQATGLYTGSVYKDYGLLKNGFPGESVSNGSVLVVKTHEWGAGARAPFRRAILLVRNPAAAIQAEFNRQSGGHVGFASPDRYRRTKGKFWLQFVNEKLTAWKKCNLDWLHNFPGPTHVIFYEQLVDNAEHTLHTVIDFLFGNAAISHITSSSSTSMSSAVTAPVNVLSKPRFRCAVDRKEGIYRRKKRLLNFDPFTEPMRAKMAAAQREVYTAIFKMATPVT